MRTLEHNKKISAALKGNPKLISALKGNKNSLGNKATLETKSKMSAARMGNTNACLPVGSTYLSNGYRLVKTAQPSIWEREHRLVLGLDLDDVRVVHHIDGDRLNNKPSNLQVFESRAEHTKHHRKE